jgi:UDP-GlcNAc3NAcA epimerase
MRVLTVLGARPQFIKSLPVSLALAEAGVEEIVVHTGQHYDHSMSGQFFEQLGLRAPESNLAVGSGTHAEQTAAIMVGVERALQLHRPGALLVYGDTNSTLAAALAAVKLHVPIAHVEAGLRNGDLRVPEEVNRVLTDRVSHWLFTPTVAAQEHLLREGTHPASIYPVGDVMLDAFLRCAPLAPSVESVLGSALSDFVLCTVHRPHHTDDPARLEAIVRALSGIAQSFPVVFPAHPRTRQALAQRSLPRNVHLIEPLGYLQILAMLQACRFVMTDSGGLQKESFFAGKRCIVLNHVSEWIELLQVAWNVLQTPDDADKLVEVALSLNPEGPAGVDRAHLYGGGLAAQRIALVMSETAEVPLAAVSGGGR